MTTTLKVYLWNEEIGRLQWDNDRKLPYFEFNPTFLGKGLDIAPLVASVTNPRSRMPIYGEKDRKYQDLPSFLADSLPDSWGNQLFEFWRTHNKISNSDVTALEKLSFIGKRGMGALEFMPEAERMSSKDKINIMSLVDLSHRIYLERERAIIKPEESLTMQSLISVGTSAGGRQPKAVIAVNKQNGEIRSGQIEGMKGYDYCILKFNDPQRSFSELEMTYYEMATRAGINMMECRLLDVEGVKHFLTLRFDRDDNGKLHTQTLAALSPECDSYEQLLHVCRKMRLSEKACEEIYRRMVFNVLAHNTDDHDKNFSFIMNRNGVWTLSPAYDITFIFNTGGYQPQADRCMMIRGKVMDITHQDVLDFAKDNGIRRPDSIIRDVVSAVKQFRQIASKYEVKEEWLGRVESCINEHLMDWGEIDNVHGGSYEWHGHVVSKLRMEQAYKGNYFMLAEVDGKEMKYIFRKGVDEYNTITQYGVSQLPDDVLKMFAEKYLLVKVKHS